MEYILKKSRRGEVGIIRIFFGNSRPFLGDILPILMGFGGEILPQMLNGAGVPSGGELGPRHSKDFVLEHIYTNARDIVAKSHFLPHHPK